MKSNILFFIVVTGLAINANGMDSGKKTFTVKFNRVRVLYPMYPLEKLLNMADVEFNKLIPTALNAAQLKISNSTCLKKQIEKGSLNQLAQKEIGQLPKATLSRGSSLRVRIKKGSQAMAIVNIRGLFRK